MYGNTGRSGTHKFGFTLGLAFFVPSFALLVGTSEAQQGKGRAQPYENIQRIGEPGSPEKITDEFGRAPAQSKPQEQNLFTVLDANNDGVISVQEMRMGVRLVAVLDTNNDGRLTRAEAGMLPRGNQPNPVVENANQGGGQQRGGRNGRARNNAGSGQRQGSGAQSGNGIAGKSTKPQGGEGDSRLPAVGENSETNPQSVGVRRQHGGSLRSMSSSEGGASSGSGTGTEGGN